MGAFFFYVAVFFKVNIRWPRHAHLCIDDSAVISTYQAKDSMFPTVALALGEQLASVEGSLCPG